MNFSSLILFRQFRAEGCLSYLFGDSRAGKVVLIDPVVELMDDYRSAIADHRLHLSMVLDTHTHADHFSASHLIAQEYGASVGMSAATASERPGVKLKNGDSIPVGALELKILATPGHTPDSLCLYSNGLLFTGDTLLIGASGRTDFMGADPRQMWSSLQELIQGFPGDTLVLPGHDYNDRLFSTLSIEKEKNPHLQVKDEEAFLLLKKAESVPNPSEEVRKRLDYNLSANPASMPDVMPGNCTVCGVVSNEPSRTASISVEKYSHKIEKKEDGVLFVDVREEEEYREGHIPGSQNIPLSSLGLHLGELKDAKRVYVSCQAGRRSQMAAKTLSYVGLEDVVNVSGGFGAWSQAGLKVERSS